MVKNDLALDMGAVLVLSVPAGMACNTQIVHGRSAATTWERRRGKDQDAAALMQLSEVHPIGQMSPNQLQALHLHILVRFHFFSCPITTQADPGLKALHGHLSRDSQTGEGPPPPIRLCACPALGNPRGTPLRPASDLPARPTLRSRVASERRVAHLLDPLRAWRIPFAA